MVSKLINSLKNSFKNLSRSVKISIGNETSITVNGKKIDPESPQGKRMLAETNKTMTHLSQSMEKMSRDLENMFK